MGSRMGFPYFPHLPSACISKPPSNQPSDFSDLLQSVHGMPRCHGSKMSRGSSVLNWSMFVRLSILLSISSLSISEDARIFRTSKPCKVRARRIKVDLDSTCNDCFICRLCASGKLRHAPSTIEQVKTLVHGNHLPAASAGACKVIHHVIEFVGL